MMIPVEEEKNSLSFHDREGETSTPAEALCCWVTLLARLYTPSLKAEC